MFRSRTKSPFGDFMLLFRVLVLLIGFTVMVTISVSYQLQSQFVSVDGHPIDSRFFKSPIASRGEYEKNDSLLESKENVTSLKDIIDDPEFKPILNLLSQAGYNLYDTREFTPSILRALPKWSDVLDLYGETKILGLESCERFRNEVPETKRLLGVAGLFNSGTNILHNLLASNCVNSETDQSTLWQVPWGKHMPESSRLSHRTKESTNINVTNVLPIISIRDPYTWMQSMCRQPYELSFDHSTDPNRNLCPNIKPYDEDIRVHPRYKKYKYMPVHAKYLNKKYDSIVHFFNEWYQQYVNITDYPRLMVRLEDIIFHADQIVPQICECYGGKQAKSKGSEIHHHARAANRNSGIDTHSAISGLLGSVIKYGNRTLRRLHYQSMQLEAAAELLDPALMQLFRYTYENP